MRKYKLGNTGLVEAAHPQWFDEIALLQDRIDCEREQISKSELAGKVEAGKIGRERYPHPTTL